MNYNPEHYYRIAYGIMLIVLIPFFVLISKTNQVTYRSPIIVVFTALLIGMTYSYIFPRQAIKLYEEILFKSFIEKNNVIIQLIVLISFSATETYYFLTGTIAPLFISLIEYLLWYCVLQGQSIVVGNKNIIIGRKLIPHHLIQSISIEKKGIFIEVDEKSFRINNWFIGKQKDKLGLVLKQIIDKY